MFNFKERIKKTGKATAEYTGKIIGVKEIKDNHNYFMKMAKIAFIPKKSSRVETFNQAQAREGVTNEVIAQIYKNYTANFYISFIFALVCLLWGGYYLTAGTYIGVFSMLSIMFVCLANCFRFSFRTYQIRHRTLCSPREWFAHKAEWFPGI